MFVWRNLAAALTSRSNRAIRSESLAKKTTYHTVVLTSTVLPGATRYGLAPILERLGIIGDGWIELQIMDDAQSAPRFFDGGALRIPGTTDRRGALSHHARQAAVCAGRGTHKAARNGAGDRWDGGWATGGQTDRGYRSGPLQSARSRSSMEKISPALMSMLRAKHTRPDTSLSLAS